MISYGGVYLTSGAPSALADGGPLALSDLYDFVRPTSPGRLSALGFPYLQRPRKPKLFSLWWPSGASRFAYGYFLADDNQLAQIRPQAFASNRLNPLPFVMSDGVRSITTNLSMLAARPLASCGAPSLWLLTLVDDRYFWGGQLGTATASGSWSSWFSSVMGQLATSTTADTVASAYGSGPTPEFAFSNSDGMPAVLDAAAACVGQRIIRTLDGNLRSIGVSGAATALTANQTLTACDGGEGGWAGGNPFAPNQWPVVAGGFLNSNEVIVPASASDENAMPGSVNVSFPTQVNGVANGLEFASLQTLTSLHLPQFGSATGSPAVQQIRLLAPALITSNPSVPDNSTALVAMAKQAALDYYGWQGNQIPDLAFDHVAPWVPTGCEDAIEWGEKATRVQRPPWNDRVEVVRPMPSGGGTTIKLVRLTGLAGTRCNYLQGYLQTFAVASGTGCVTFMDGDGLGGSGLIDVLDANL